MDLPARFRTRERSLDGRAVDLSPGGMRFVGGLGAGFPGDAPDVEIELDLPDSGTALRLRGEVRWCEARGAAGIRFTEIAVGARRRLANLILRAFAAT